MFFVFVIYGLSCLSCVNVKGGDATHVCAVGGGFCEGGRTMGTVKAWNSQYGKGTITADVDDGTGDLLVMKKVR